MYEDLASLELEIDSVDRRRLERDTTSGFTRVSTEVSLSGQGATGRGEDVSYEAADHEGFAEVDLPLAGEYTLRSFAARLDDLTLYPDDPADASTRHYRRWGLESAALDLALRQADLTLGEAIGREYDPVRFVVSTRLDDPEGDGGPTLAPIERVQERHADLAFKLDPTPSWSDEFVERLAATADVAILDLKGYYEGTDVDNPADPDLYRRLLAAFPDGVVEDPRFTDGTESLLAENADRLSWDAPITGVDAVRDLPVSPQWLNCKPSRFGTLESLCAFLEYCERNAVSLYGGGQFELGVGRDQIQALASLVYPEGPNDVAPGGYNQPTMPAGLPASPLDPDPPAAGFGWAR